MPARKNTQTVHTRYDLNTIAAVMAAIESASDDRQVAIVGRLEIYLENEESGIRETLAGTISFQPGDGYNVPKFLPAR